MATTKQTQIIAAATTIGLGIGIVAITVGIIGTIAQAIGGWFWWIGGGIIILITSLVLGVIVQVVSGSLTIIKRIK